MNWSALSDSELLVHVEQGNADACRAAAERLREIVDAGYYRREEVEDAREEGRQTFANSLYCQYATLLNDVSADGSPLNQEWRQKLRELRNEIMGAM